MHLSGCSATEAQVRGSVDVMSAAQMVISVPVKDAVWRDSGCLGVFRAGFTPAVIPRPFLTQKGLAFDLNALLSPSLNF